MNKRPLDKTKKKNIKCEHCKYFVETNETPWGFPIMKCNCQNGKWHNEERRYWNRCKCFEWHERYDHLTEKGGEG